MAPTNILANSPGVMLVVNAEDLKSAIRELWNDHKVETRREIEADKERPTMTRHQAARALNINLTTLWRWAKDGYLSPVKIGSKVLYRASDIEAMLERRKGGAA